MKHLLFTCLGFFVVCLSTAQISRQLNTSDEALSPSEQRFQNLLTDSETKKLEYNLLNPAAIGLSSIDSLTTSYVNAGYAFGEMDGDFLIYEGNCFRDYQISGFGKKQLPKVGTLYGQARYAQGKHENIVWNSVRHPELYLPYIATDSIGGDFDYKEYALRGGVAFDAGEWHLGVEVSFRGEQAYRETDPRSLNTTSWVSGKIGAGRYIGAHHIMIGVGAERNKQHTTMRFWRAAEQQRFYVTYGFGQYDKNRSLVLFGYSRMYYINNKDVNLTYQSPKDKALSVYLRMAYQYSKMETEEADKHHLHNYHSHIIQPTVELKYVANKRWHNALMINSYNSFKKGTENVLQRYMVDPITRLYDYRKIDEQQNYRLDIVRNTAFLKSTLIFNGSQLSLFGGAKYDYRKESYKVDQYVVHNSSLTPYVGLEYVLDNDKHELFVNVAISKKNNLDAEYDVILPNKDSEGRKVDNLDFQHAFTPYAYHNSSYRSFRINATYMKQFKHFGLGTNLQLMHTKGRRAADAIYDKTPDLVSPTSIISTRPDVHNEQWGSISLFVVL